MNLSDISEDFHRQLEVAKPDAQLRVILKLNLPTFVPANPNRRPTREEIGTHQDLCSAASIPIKEQLEAIGLQEVGILSNLALATIRGTPDQVKRAVALKEVTEAMHDADTVLIQGDQDDKGHAGRVTGERKDKGPPQVGG
jgi:hypothetical protein